MYTYTHSTQMTDTTYIYYGHTILQVHKYISFILKIANNQVEKYFSNKQ